MVFVPPAGEKLRESGSNVSTFPSWVTVSVLVTPPKLKLISAVRGFAPLLASKLMYAV